MEALDNRINNLDKYFKGQQTNETLICFMRHHWISMVKEFSYFIIFLLVIILSLVHIDTIMTILRGNRELKLLFFTGFLLVTVYMHRFFLKFFNYFVNVGIITDIRFIDHQKNLFFKDSIDSIDMLQIQNIEMLSNGLLPNLLGYGDIKVYLSASSGIKTFSCIPNAKFHFRCLSRQKESRQNLLRERVHQNHPQSTDEQPVHHDYLHQKTEIPLEK